MRQRYDYSCGAASLATLMTYYFSDPVSERALLEQLMDAEPDADLPRDAVISMEDLAGLARRRGYAVRAVEVSRTLLKRLRQPVIVHLVANGEAHFSVIRGVGPAGAVHLADPSWGQRYLSRWQFAQLLGGAADTVTLLIVGRPGASAPADGYFSNRPRRNAFLRRARR